ASRIACSGGRVGTQSCPAGAPFDRWAQRSFRAISKRGLWRATVERIDTYGKFKRWVVDPDFRDFTADVGDLRRMWHCAGSLFHLHDWVYVAHKSSIDAKYTFVDDRGLTQSVSRLSHGTHSLGQTFPEFELIRGIANSSKHCELRPVPPGRISPPGMPTAAANTYVTGVAFQPGAFQSDAFQSGEVKLETSTG